jgi:uncharacterized cupredoxin-like copper-binding protein
MKFRKLLPFLALAILLVPALAGCSGSGSKTIDAALDTYKITLSANTAKAGEITFHVHNDATDQKVHEFVVFKTDLAADQLPLTADGIVDEEGAGVTLIDEVEDVAPGTAQDLEVELEPGKYVLLCNIDSNEQHYAHGMHVAFTVQ